MTVKKVETVVNIPSIQKDFSMKETRHGRKSAPSKTENVMLLEMITPEIANTRVIRLDETPTK
jgi:hypothetical protein